MCRSCGRFRALGVVTACVLLLMLQLSPPASAQYEDIYNRSVPSIVLIRGPLLTGGVVQGTGFVVGRSGYILTNHHVIEGMTEINITLYGRRTIQAHLLGYIREVLYGRSIMGSLPDKIVDLAVLKVDAGELSALPLGNSNQLREGQEIIILGFPGRVPTDHVSIVRGIISAVHEGWVQTDAAFDSGNSGGPVLDRDGRVVGLVTFITGANMKLGGFVPINRVDELTSGVASGRQFKESFWVSGMEYVPVIRTGRRVTYQQTYTPATGQGSVTTYTTEVTSVKSASGAYIYTIRDSSGTVFTNYLSSEGLVTVRRANNTCTTEFDDNAYVIPPLPITTASIGTFWKFGSRTRCSSGETTEATMTSTVKRIDETLELPTGRFSGVLHIVEKYVQVTKTANGQRRYVAQELDIFRAPKQIGDVLTVTRDMGTGEKWTTLLLRIEKP